MQDVLDTKDREAMCGALAFCMGTYETLQCATSLGFFGGERAMTVYPFFPDAVRFRVVWTDPLLHSSDSRVLKEACIGLPCHYCGIFEHSDKQETYIAFVGSTTMKDWATNLAAYSTFTSAGDGVVGASSAGFAARASTIPIDSIIAKLNKKHRVVICGHSLGGAIAALVTRRVLSDARLMHSTDLVSRFQCITFAAPLYCNAPHDHYSEHFLHFAHESDIVVTLPLLVNKIASSLEHVASSSMFSDVLQKLTGGLSSAVADASNSGLSGAFSGLAGSVSSTVMGGTGEGLPPWEHLLQTALSAFGLSSGAAITAAPVVLAAGSTLALSTLRFGTSFCLAGYAPHGRFVVVKAHPGSFSTVNGDFAIDGDGTTLTELRALTPRNVQIHSLAVYINEMRRVRLLPPDADMLPASVVRSALSDPYSAHSWAVHIDVSSPRTCSWLDIAHGSEEKTVYIALAGSNLDWVGSLRLFNELSRSQLVLARCQLPEYAVFSFALGQRTPAHVVGTNGAFMIKLEFRARTTRKWLPLQIRYDIDRSRTHRQSHCAPDTIMFAALLMMLRDTSTLPDGPSAGAAPIAATVDRPVPTIQTSVALVAIDLPTRAGGHIEFPLVFMESLVTDAATGSSTPICRWVVNRRFSQFVNLDAALRERLPIPMRSIDFPPRSWGSKTPEFVETRRQALLVYMSKVLEAEKGICFGLRDVNPALGEFVCWPSRHSLNILPKALIAAGPASLSQRSVVLPSDEESLPHILSIMLTSLQQLKPSTETISRVQIVIFARLLASFAMYGSPELLLMTGPRMLEILSQKDLGKHMRKLLEDVSSRRDLMSADGFAARVVDTTKRLLDGAEFAVESNLKDILGSIEPVDGPGFVPLLPVESCNDLTWSNRKSALTLHDGAIATNEDWDSAARQEACYVIASRATVAFWTVVMCRDTLNLHPFNPAYFALPVLAVVAAAAIPIVGWVLALGVGAVLLIGSLTGMVAVWASLSYAIREQYSARVHDLVKSTKQGALAVPGATNTMQSERLIESVFAVALGVLKASPLLVSSDDAEWTLLRSTLVQSHIAPMLVTTLPPSGYKTMVQQLVFVSSIHHLRNYVFRQALVPVFGTQNAGKSTLCASLMPPGRRDVFQPGTRNTRVPTCVRVDLESDYVTLVDFPGIQDNTGASTGIGLELLPVAAAVVLVLPFDQANNVSVSKILSLLATHPNAPGDVLVCLSRVDEFLVMAKNAARQARPSIAQTPAIDFDPMAEGYADLEDDAVISADDTTIMVNAFISQLRDARLHLIASVSGDTHLDIVPIMFAGKTGPSPMVDVKKLQEINSRVAAAVPEMLPNLMNPPGAVGSGEMIVYGPKALKRFLAAVCTKWNRDGLGLGLCQ